MSDLTDHLSEKGNLSSNNIVALFLLQCSCLDAKIEIIFYCVAHSGLKRSDDRIACSTNMQAMGQVLFKPGFFQASFITACCY